MPTTTASKRVLSGMRPTGRLHIGHYFGALQNWVKLQADPSYDCFYFVADWHALTSDYADASAIAENTLQIAMDYLAAGLDPAKSTIFQQTLVPDHAELHLLLSMVTPLGWLERIPTYKEALDNITNKDLHTYGFLGYPVLQTADIVMYSDPGKALFVPVGEDQISHVEFSRELVRRFNTFYGISLNKAMQEKSAAGLWNELYAPLSIPGPRPPLADFPLSAEKWIEYSSVVKNRIIEIGTENAKDRLRAAVVADCVKFERVLEEPQSLLTRTPRIPGLDGRKMSKSYGNAITLSESDADIRAKTKVMMTDPARKRRSDPGNPGVCPVYDWHKLFSPPETLAWAAEGCRAAGIGCIDCKAKMAEHLIAWLDREKIRERRLDYEKRPKDVLEILDQGSQKARQAARETMSRVREAVFGWQRKREEMASGE